MERVGTLGRRDSFSQDHFTPDLREPEPSSGFGLRSLFVSSEIFPLAKTGGLADVSAALPIALGKLGVDIRLLMPGYSEALDRVVGKRILTNLPDDWAKGPARLVSGCVPDS